MIGIGFISQTIISAVVEGFNFSGLCSSDGFFLYLRSSGGTWGFSCELVTGVDDSSSGMGSDNILKGLILRLFHPWNQPNLNLGCW